MVFFFRLSNPELKPNLEKTARTKRKPTNKAALRTLPVFVSDRRAGRITGGDAVTLGHSQPENVNNSLLAHMLAAAAQTRVEK